MVRLGRCFEGYYDTVYRYVLGIYLPYHYYGGFQPMFEAVEALKPGFYLYLKKE